MITSLRLRNFQSHRDTHLQLHPGVNAIVGASDSGKSALLRGLEWVRTNRPSGDDFRSHWGGDTSVTVGLEDGAEIVRERTDRVNQYRVGDLLLKAMGADVPEEVRQALGLEDLNIQLQMDSHFLLSESPGEVSRQLNEVANLQIIDTATARAASAVREARGTLARSQAAEAALTEQLAQFEDIDRREEAVGRLERMVSRYQEEVGRHAALGSLISLALEAEEALEATADLPTREARLKAVEEEAARCAHQRESWRVLVQLREAAEKLEAVRDAAGVLLPARERVEALAAKETQWVIAKDRLWLLHDLMETARACSASIAQASAREDALQKEIDRATPRTCPTCGQPWPKEAP